MTHALVTGATGFIGYHVVRELRSQGCDVSCLVRPESNRSRIEAYRPCFISGDVNDREAISSALRGVDVVYHLAGATKALSTRTLERVNVDGVRNVAACCAKMSTPPVLVIMSSLAAAGPSIDGVSRSERDVPAPVSEYGHSKLAGEYAAARYAGDVPISIVRPPIVLGEADRDGLSLFSPIARWGVHFIPSLRDERFSIIHASDLALAVTFIAVKGQRLPANHSDPSCGVYYATTGAPPTYRELGQMIAKSFDRESLHCVRTPIAAVWGIAAVNELLSKVRHQPSILSLDKAREATAGSWTCTGAALRRDTQFVPAFSLQQRINQTSQWYVDQGWLKAPSAWRKKHPRVFAKHAHD